MAGTDRGKAAEPTASARRPTPAPTTEKQEIAAASGSSSTATSSAADDEAQDEELRIIPPEVVSGAYLTCATIPSSEEKAPEGYAYHGCSTYDANGERLDLERVETDFQLLDMQGAEVAAERIELTGRDEDVIWEVALADVARGLAPLLTVVDADGQPRTIGQQANEFTVSFNGSGFSAQFGGSSSTDRGDAASNPEYPTYPEYPSYPSYPLTPD